MRPRSVAGALIVSVGLIGASVSAAACVGTLPSCSSHRWDGDAGYVAVQQETVTAALSWGAYPHVATTAPSQWTVTIYVDGKKFDQKTQSYPPHGSVPSGSIVPGRIFELAGRDTLPNGSYATYHGACIMAAPGGSGGGGGGGGGGSW